MKKRVFVIFIAVLLTVFFTSCSSKENSAEPADKQQETESVETGDIVLTDVLKKDSIPVFKGGVILESQEHTDMTGFIIYDFVYYSDKKFEDVKAYYEEALSKYTIEQEQYDRNFYNASALIDDEHRIDISVIDLSTETDPEVPKDAKTLFQIMYWDPTE
jgi:hypothetical protein